MGTNALCSLKTCFLFSYKAKFIHTFLSTWRKRIVSQFNFTFLYRVGVSSINNPYFQDQLSVIYPYELKIKETTESNRSDFYFAKLIPSDNNGNLNTSLYEN